MNIQANVVQQPPVQNQGPAGGRNRRQNANRQNRRNRNGQAQAQPNPLPQIQIQAQVQPQPVVVALPVQQQNVVPVIPAPFHGTHPMAFSEKYTFGPQAEAILRNKYANLVRANKFEMSKIENHEHPYGAFLRKHYHNIIINGLTPNPIIDIGGHATRLASLRRWSPVTQQYAPASTTIHSMLPMIAGLDEIRHKNWSRQIAMRNYGFNLHANDFLVPNSCRTMAGDLGVCDCFADRNPGVNMPTTDLTSIDSYYYPGVPEAIDRYLCTHNAASAYITIHDYKKAYDEGFALYKTPDDESCITITEEQGDIVVYSDVKGNPVLYKHRIVDTANGRTWGRYFPQHNRTVVYTVEEKSQCGKHDYIIIHASAIVGQIENIPLLPNNRYYVVKPRKSFVQVMNQGVQDILRYTGTAVQSTYDSMLKMYYAFRKMHNVSDEEDVEIRRLIRWVTKQGYSNGALQYDKDEKVYIITVVLHALDVQEKNVDKYVSLRFIPHLLPECLRQIYGRNEQQAVFQIQRYLQSISGAKYTPETLNGTVLLAAYIATEQGLWTTKILSTTSNIELTKRMKNPFSFRWPKLTCWDFLRAYGMTLLTLSVIIYMVTNWINKSAVAAAGNFMANGAVDPLYLIGCLWLTTYVMFTITSNLKTSKSDKDKYPKNLKSSCVTIVDRLDIEKNKGVYDPKLKIRDHDWDIKGLTGQEAMDKLGCSHENHYPAMQIGPLFHGNKRRDPTIKHGCKRCVWAAAIKAMSNRIRPDESMFRSYEQFVLDLVPRIRRTIVERGGLDISIEKWLAHYPMKYREQMEKERLSIDGIRSQKYNKYESFPKVELQFTEVEDFLKDTKANDVKERQISGPSNKKKLAAGALTWFLEEIFQETFKWYCGRQNWQQICGKFDAFEKDVARQNQHMFGPPSEVTTAAADCSRLDITVTKQNHELLATVMTLVVENNPDIRWDCKLDRDLALQAYRDSVEIVVEVGRGAVQYTSDGRASGDSWTTLANTFLVGTKMAYAASTVGFNPDMDGYKDGWMPLAAAIKGDDSVTQILQAHKALLETAYQSCFAREDALIKHGLGMIIKRIDWGDIDQLTFLSCNFFRQNDGTLRMIREPKRVFQTMGWSLKVHKDLRGWRGICPQLAYAKGQCMLAWAKGLPIFEELAKTFMRIGCPPDETLVTDYNIHVDPYRVWESDMELDCAPFYDWLFSKFGITKTEADQLTDIISELEAGDLISHPTIEKFYQ